MLIGVISIVLLVILIKVFNKTDSNGKTKNSVKTNKKIPGSTGWPSLGNFEFEIVGESNYQNALKKLAGEHGNENVRAEVIAELIPEDNNKYDSKAIAVKIQNELVGYLAKEEARMFRRRLGQKGLSDKVTTCAAIIVGGGIKKNGERLFYGVKLDIKPFEC